jgi:hypothetical protein
LPSKDKNLMRLVTHSSSFPPEPDSSPSPNRPVFRVVTSPGEAEEHLRVIRQAMERSTRHSTLSGLSGVVVGLIALAGCGATATLVARAPSPLKRYEFIGVWVLVFVLSLVADTVLTKRRAAMVGKTARSPLGRHLARAAAPGLLAAVILSVFFTLHPGLRAGYLYLNGIWMVCYAVSLLGVGMFSRAEVSALGWAFLAAGAVTLLLPPNALLTPMLMMALTFGGFHIAYGVLMGRRYGW